mmetsp:Transcript_63098/g.176470  ORF Transcript_63098/g.176470 Transcript_63098/m.176470 type:complete len:366 (-) Transcript_63098:526-1623(-)
MRLLGEVAEVDAEAEHVAPVPSVPPRAELAAVVAERCSEPLPARDGAILRGVHVGRRKEPVPVDAVQDLDIGAVVELHLAWGSAVLLCEIPAVGLVLPLQLRVLNGAHTQHTWPTVVEGRASHERADDLITLGTVQGQILHDVGRACCREGPVLAPTWVHVSQIPAAAVAGDDARALLAGGPMGIVDRHSALNAALHEGLSVEGLHLLPHELHAQPDFHLRELPAHDADLRAPHPGGVPPQEAPHVALELLVCEVPVQVAQPEGVRARRAHRASAIRRDLPLWAATARGGDPHAGWQGREPRARGLVDHRRGEGAVGRGGTRHGHKRCAHDEEQGGGARAPRLLGLRRELASSTADYHDLARRKA